MSRLWCLGPVRARDIATFWYFPRTKPYSAFDVSAFFFGVDVFFVVPESFDSVDPESAVLDEERLSAASESLAVDFFSEPSEFAAAFTVELSSEPDLESFT